MPPPPYPGVRLLPNAVTVFALCSGLSAVYFAFSGRFELSIAAAGIAALCDALDGRLARMLDASTRIGAELDSLSDLVAFGVAPALVLYIWELNDLRFGWTFALVFAVCMALRLARFNTLIDVEDPYPFTKEFFVGVPAPAAALAAGIPLYLWLHFGPGWWSSELVVAGWTVLVAGLMVSRFPTLSFKTARVSPNWVAPVLVLVVVAAAVVVTMPFLGLAVVSVGYLALIPYSMHRYRWLRRHPEAWDVPGRDRRAVARAARSARRLGLRSPLRRRVAGRASAVARAVRRFGEESGAVRRPGEERTPLRRFGEDPPPRGPAGNGRSSGPGPASSRNRLRLGLRRARRR